MEEGSSPYIVKIQACEAAIGRIRAAIQAGQSNSEQVAEDFELVRTTAAPLFVKFARSVERVGPTAAEEALEAMEERLLRDIWSPTFVSLETGFGVYIKQMPIRIIQTITRKNTLGSASFPMERLDAPIGEDGMLLHEAVSDPHASAEVEAVAEREALQQALAQLPPMERQALMLRMQGESNNMVAESLGVSQATASRLYRRAVDQLKRLLGPSEE
jgi:RNA polymerase sigma factor (sigma-70 family)